MATTVLTQDGSLTTSHAVTPAYTSFARVKVSESKMCFVPFSPREDTIAKFLFTLIRYCRLKISSFVKLSCEGTDICEDVILRGLMQRIELIRTDPVTHQEVNILQPDKSSKGNVLLLAKLGPSLSPSPSPRRRRIANSNDPRSPFSHATDISLNDNNDHVKFLNTCPMALVGVESSQMLLLRLKSAVFPEREACDDNKSKQYIPRSAFS